MFAYMYHRKEEFQDEDWENQVRKIATFSGQLYKRSKDVNPWRSYQ